MSSRQRIALGVLAVVLIAMAGRTIWILIEGPKEILAPVVYEKAAAAQETAAEFESVDLPAGPNVLAPSSEVVAAATRALPPSLKNLRQELGAPEGAIGAGLEFLSAISTGDVHAYDTWRASQGFRFPNDYPDASAAFQEMLSARYEAVLGTPRPDGMTARAYYENIFPAYLEQDGGALRPEAIIVAPGGLECRYKYITHPDDHLAYTLETPDGLGNAFWVGGTTGSCVQFWEYDATMSELVERHGGVWRARIWIALRGARGHVIPTQLRLTFDPAPGRRWFVHRWTVSNIGRHARVTDAAMACGVF